MAHRREKSGGFSALAGALAAALLIVAAPVAGQTVPPPATSTDTSTELTASPGRAPGYLIDHQPLAGFLEWAAQQTGRELVFSSPEARDAASRIVLRGTIAGVDAESALVAVMATTSLKLSEPPGLIVVGVNTL